MHFYSFAPSTTLVIILLCLFAPTTAHAQKLYISAYTGNSYTPNTDVRFRQPSINSDFTIRNMRFDSRYLSEAPYYGVRVGTWFRKRSPFGLSLELRHHKAFGHTDHTRQIEGTVNGQSVSGNQRVDDYVKDFRLTDGINTINLNVYYRWMFRTTNGFPEGRLQTYVGGGPSYYITYAHSEINGVDNPHTGYDGEGFGYNLLSGVRYSLSSRFALFGEVAYSSGRRKSLDIGQGGTATLDINGYHLSFGLMFTVF